MLLSKLIGYLVSVVIFFFALIFALASSYNPSRILVSCILFIVGFGLLFFIWRRQPSRLIQKIEIPGRIKAQELSCPNCSASLDLKKTKIVKGVMLVECEYCGNVFDLTEEPKW